MIQLTIRALVLGTLLLLMTGCATVGLAENLTLLQTVPRPCPDGTLIYELYDSDGFPDNGPEVIKLYSESRKHIGTVWYAPGEGGTFQRAEIGGQVFISYEAMIFAFPQGPCSFLGNRT